MNCENCKKDCKPEEQVPAMVPLYAVEESAVDVDANDGVANYIGNDGDIVNSADYGN